MFGLMLIKSCLQVHAKETLFLEEAIFLFLFVFCKHLSRNRLLSFISTVADFQKLQEAKEVLCNEDKRKNYDLWKRSGVTIPFHDWQALNDSVKTVCNVLTLLFFGFSKQFKAISVCSWSSVCSRCTGLWEPRKSRCWRTPNQKGRSLHQQTSMNVSRRHQSSLHARMCNLQVGEIQQVLKITITKTTTEFLNRNTSRWYMKIQKGPKIH